MAGQGRRWTRGCGVGCGLVALLVVLAGIAGYAWLRGLIGDAERIETVRREVRERYGSVSDFTPEPDGSIPRERLEAFLQVRERMAPARAEAEATLAVLSRREQPGAAGISGVLGRLLALGMGVRTVEAGTELLPQVFSLISSQADALLETGMGPGEYTYIYAVTYYCWLGKSPADGPGFRLVSGEESQGRQSADAFDVRESRREEILRRLNRTLVPMLQRQAATLDETPGVETDAWRRELEAEIAAMEEDRYRIPWRDGLPPRVEASLRPFRRQLLSSYSPMCNAIEVLLGTED